MWKGERFLKLRIKYNGQNIARILENYNLNKKIATTEERNREKQRELQYKPQERKMSGRT